MKLRAIQGGKSGPPTKSPGWPPKDLDGRIDMYRRALIREPGRKDEFLMRLLLGIWNHGYATAMLEKP